MDRVERFLVAENETVHARERRRLSTGRSSGETYADTLRTLVPHAIFDIVHPTDGETPRLALAGYDAVFLSGSPTHLYEETPEVRRQIAFMRAVLASGTPSFGSCVGLQLAVTATGGRVRAGRRGHEAGFARRISPTEEGHRHPLLAGRPEAYDAPSIHADEVEALPEHGALCLAGNRVTPVQAAEIVSGPGTFWGVQYHPELPLSEIADALRRQADDLLDQGFVRDREELESYAALVDILDREPERRDVAWRLGLDEQVTDAGLRQTELRNFIDRLVRPTMSRRGRA